MTWSLACGKCVLNKHIMKYFILHGKPRAEVGTQVGLSHSDPLAHTSSSRHEIPLAPEHWARDIHSGY